MAWPLVSVVMSVYNGERFLGDAIDSVLGQTLGDIELVVVDDGSTDATPDILASYAASDHRVVLHRHENQGLPRSLNVGIALARAAFVARLDADDAALPDRLRLQHAFLVAHDAVAVVGGAVDFADETGRVFAPGVQYPLTDREIRAAFPHTTPLLHPAVLARKAAIEEVGGYRAIFDEAEDLDLWLRIAERHELANLPNSVVRYRIHAAQATVRRLELQTLCCVAARLSARARADSGVDPLDGVERIDARTLDTLGATQQEITYGLVKAETWLAMTMDRAGYADRARTLFADARARARSRAGSRGLAAHVRRARARRFAERGMSVRSRVERLRARLEEGLG
jgi:glycosyltransferase involved in cell wall biosynthesis